MSERDSDRILHALVEEFSSLHTTLPDFRFITIKGPGVMDRESFFCLVKVFVGRITDIEAGPGSQDGITVFYGDHIESGKAALEARMEGLVQTFRILEEDAMEDETPPQNEPFPIVRGPAAVFIYANALAKMAETLPQNISESFATLGIPNLKIIGGPKIYSGYPSIAANGNSIEFPGNLIAQRPDDDPAWPRLVAAVREGQFFVEYSPASLFNIIAEVVRSFGTFGGSIISAGMAPLKSAATATALKTDKSPERANNSALPDSTEGAATSTDPSIKPLAPSRLKAYQQFRQVTDRHPTMFNDLSAAYDHFVDHMYDAGEDGQIVKKDTWVDYVQQAMRHPSLSRAVAPPSIRDLPQDRNRES